MGLDPKDYDVVKLLTKLKTISDVYPLEMFASRRQKYISRVAIRSLSLTPQAQEITSPPELSSPLPELNASEIPNTIEEHTPTETTTGTPILTETTNDNKNVNNNNNQGVSAPNPSGNNGNHFGQTPKPERTKKDGENSPGNDGNGKDK